MFRHKYRYLFALLLSLYTFANTEFCNLYIHFNLNVPWEFALGTISLITFAILEFNRLTENFIRKQVPASTNRFMFPGIFFAAGSILATLITIVIVYLVALLLNRSSINEIAIPLKLNLIYAWLVNLLYHLINTILIFFRESRDHSIKAEEIKRFHAQSELQLVKSQINPHFLFNNLNVLSSLVMQNNGEANQFIDAFSKVYRYILHNHEKELVPLSEEINHIEPYIFLLKKRFGDGLGVSVEIPDHYSNAWIIPAALQMLIENAIKHNVVSRNKPLHIRLHANGNHTLSVSNNLQIKKDVEYSTGTGLQNIIKRYQLVSGKKVAVEKTESEFTVLLPLLKNEI